MGRPRALFVFGKWQSAWLQTEGLRIWVSLALLCCVLEQDSLFLASFGSTQEGLSWHNWKIVDWDVKNQIKQNENVFFFYFYITEGHTNLPWEAMIQLLLKGGRYQYF